MLEEGQESCSQAMCMLYAACNIRIRLSCMYDKEFFGRRNFSNGKGNGQFSDLVFLFNSEIVHFICGILIKAPFSSNYL